LGLIVSAWFRRRWTSLIVAGLVLVPAFCYLLRGSASSSLPGSFQERLIPGHPWSEVCNFLESLLHLWKPQNTTLRRINRGQKVRQDGSTFHLPLKLQRIPAFFSEFLLALKQLRLDSPYLILPT
jgi:hypothetical protein